MTVTAEARVSSRAAQALQTRRRLVRAAVDQFSQKRYEDVAVADITRAAGVAHGLLFHYFGSKRGIYLEAVRESAMQLDAAFAFDPALAPEPQLRRALSAHLRYLSEHRGLALRVLSGRGADPAAWEVFESGRWRAVEATVAVAGLDSARASVRLAGRAAVGAIDEATIHWLNHGEPFDVEVMVEWMMRVAAAAVEHAKVLDSDAKPGPAGSRIH